MSLYFLERQRIPKVLPLSEYSQFAELYTLGGFPKSYRWSGILELNQGLPPYQSGALYLLNYAPLLFNSFS